MLFAVEPENVLGLILALATLLVGAVTTIVMGYIAYLTIKLDKGQTIAAVHAAEVVAEAKDTRRALKVSADEVKHTLAETTATTSAKLAEVAEVADLTHKIVNQQRSDMVTEINNLKNQVGGLLRVLEKRDAKGEKP